MNRCPLGFSFCCSRGEVAQKTKELDLSKLLNDASYMSRMNGKERNWLPTDPEPSKIQAPHRDRDG